MSEDLEQQLIKSLSEAHALEKQALQLLDKGASLVGDEEIARIYRAHKLQTEEHARYVAERLEAHGASPSTVKDLAMQIGALGIGAAAGAAPDTPMRLATTAFAFENVEIATYHLIEGLARRAGDQETAAVAERILQEEEAAAELVAGTFDRTLDLVLGEPPNSPLPPVTPIGRPSERELDPAAHQGPQSFKDVPADQPLGEPPHVDDPAEASHLQSPEPGHPADTVQPHDGEVPEPTHPERIGSTEPGTTGR
jgi:ferritin-like metal-binding protein YciE